MALLAVGCSTMAYLFWRLDARAIWGNVSKIGMGMCLILLLPVVDHALNALGWMFSFNRKDAAGLSYWRLVMIRIAGDGVNYLTPSATIAGEVVRPAMLGGALSGDAKIASVVIARFTQSLGQALFIMVGLLIVVGCPIPLIDRFPLMVFIRHWIAVPIAVLAFTLAAIAVYTLRALRGGGRASPKAVSIGRWASVKSEIGDYFVEHPGRFAVSTVVFTLSYFWGCMEIFLICFFMGTAVTPIIALAIEALSSTLDGVMFMVPAKIGTQEAGKTAIFTGLGYPASQGFALGLIRHIRELIWASAGLLLYALHRRRIEKS